MNLLRIAALFAVLCGGACLGAAVFAIGDARGFDQCCRRPSIMGRLGFGDLDEPAKIGALGGAK